MSRLDVALAWGEGGCCLLKPWTRVDVLSKDQWQLRMVAGGRVEVNWWYVDQQGVSGGITSWNRAQEDQVFLTKVTFGLTVTTVCTYIHVTQ